MEIFITSGPGLCLPWLKAHKPDVLVMRLKSVQHNWLMWSIYLSLVVRKRTFWLPTMSDTNRAVES